MIWYNFRVDFSEKRDGTNQQKFNFPTASVHSSQQGHRPQGTQMNPNGALEPAGVKTRVFTDLQIEPLLNHRWVFTKTMKLNNLTVG